MAKAGMDRGLWLAVVIFFGLVSFAEAATVYTADEAGQTLSVIDTEKGTSVQVDVPIMPHNVDMTQDQKTLLVTGMDMENHQTMSGKLLVFNVSSSKPELVKEIIIGKHLAHVVPAADGRTAYVTDSAANEILIVDYKEGKLLGQIPVGKFPHGIRLSPDGKMLAVANMEGESVSIVDPVLRAEIRKITVGRKPVQVAFTPSGKHLVVSLNGENRVAIVDINKADVIRKVKVGHGPVQVFVIPDGKQAFVANQGAKSKPDNRLSIIDMQGNGALKNLVTGNGAHGVFITLDGKQAFVTNSAADTLSVVDTASAKVIRTIHTGKSPNGVVAR